MPGGTPPTVLAETPCDGTWTRLRRAAGLGGASIQNASGWTPLHIFVQKHALVLGVGKTTRRRGALRVLIDAHPAAAGPRTRAAKRVPSGLRRA